MASTAQGMTVEQVARMRENLCHNCGTETANTISWPVGYGRYVQVPMCDTCEDEREAARD